MKQLLGTLHIFGLGTCGLFALRRTLPVFAVDRLDKLHQIVAVVRAHERTVVLGQHLLILPAAWVPLNLRDPADERLCLGMRQNGPHKHLGVHRNIYRACFVHRVQLIIQLFFACARQPRRSLHSLHTAYAHIPVHDQIAFLKHRIPSCKTAPPVSSRTGGRAAPCSLPCASLRRKSKQRAVLTAGLTFLKTTRCNFSVSRFAAAAAFPVYSIPHFAPNCKRKFFLSAARPPKPGGQPVQNFIRAGLFPTPYAYKLHEVMSKCTSGAEGGIL